MPLYLGIDIGTPGVRACAIDDEEVERGQASSKLPEPERNVSMTLETQGLRSLTSEG